MTLLLCEKPPFRRTRDYSAYLKACLFLPFGTVATLVVLGMSIAAQALRVSLLHFHVESMAPLQQFLSRPVTPLPQFPSRPVTPPTPWARHGALASRSFSPQRSNAFRPGFFLKGLSAPLRWMPWHFFSFILFGEFLPSGEAMCSSLPVFSVRQKSNNITLGPIFRVFVSSTIKW
jgi:hypothetical protein